MPTPRNIGMTSFGILNIVFGSMGCFMIISTMMGQSPSGGESSGMTATLIGILGMACWAVMAFAGFGLLKMTPWCCKFTKWSAMGALGVIALTYFTSGFSFNVFTMAAIGYCCACLYMCMTPQWKSAFGGQPMTGTPSMPGSSSTPTHGYDQYRDAA